MGEQRKNKPLTARVNKDVLTIEIGVDTLAFATLRSQHVYEMLPPRHRHSREELEKRFSIPDATGFAEDVSAALLCEEEDGSSPLTDLFDKAAAAAIDDGSLHFIDKNSKE